MAIQFEHGMPQKPQLPTSTERTREQALQDFQQATSQALGDTRDPKKEGHKAYDEKGNPRLYLTSKIADAIRKLFNPKQTISHQQ